MVIWLLDAEGWHMIKEMRDQGMRIGKIAETMGISRPTVRRYLSARKPPQYSKKHRASKLEAFKPYIAERIQKYDLTAKRILEEIQAQGYTGGYTILKEYCRTLRKDRAILAVYRFETLPGKQSQIDFGDFGHIPVDGKRRKLYVFSYVLGFSRYRYVEFIIDIGTQNLENLHIHAFRYTGGIPDEILYDNLKQVVLDRKIKAGESTFNPEFQRFSEYYGFVTRLCWPRRPQTKGKVENSIKYIKNNFFRGLEFESLQDLNNLALSWIQKVNNKIHGSTGRMPSEMVHEEPLSPVDAVPEYTFSISEERKVSRECYVHWKGNRYSVHWKHAGRIAMCKEDSGILRISVGDDLYEHEILAGSGRISRKKEHFEGLLKAIRDQNYHNYEVDVQRRDLKEYEVS